MADIYYEDAQFGMAINTMTQASEELNQLGISMLGVLGGELGPRILEQAVTDAAGQWRAGADKLAKQARNIAENINAEIVAYQALDHRAQETFAELILGLPRDDRPLPHLQRQPIARDDPRRWAQ